MKAVPYLYFAGACAEALEFYRNAIGAEIRALTRYRDMPGTNPDAGERVMHAELRIGESTIFASDGQRMERRSGGYAMTLQATDDVEAERLFAALSAGGKTDVPLMTTPFASRFGMLTDRYGTPWIVQALQAASSEKLSR
jgi:PhnB protein